MTLLPFLHFSSVLVCIYLMVYVLYKNRKSLLNLSCSVLLMCFGIWNFGDVFIHNPNSTFTADTAMIFQNIISIGWIGFASALFCFSLTFSKREQLLTKKWFLFLAFILPLFFIYKQWTGCLLINPVRQSYGWSFVMPPTIWTYLFYIYYLLPSLLSIYFIYFYGRKTSEIIEKKQTKIIIFSVIISLMLGSITDVVLPQLGVFSIPTIADIFFLVFAVGLAYAIVKYKFFMITPAFAAENIIAAMDELLILLNPEGIIITVNYATLSILQYERKELEGKSVTLLFQEANFSKNILEKFTKEKVVKDQNSNLLTKNGKTVPVIYSSSLLKNEKGIRGGTILIARDISERKQAEQLMEQEKKRTEVILSALDTGLSLINPDMTIAWVNQKIREMFPGKEPVGQLCHVFYESRETICDGCGTLKAFMTGKVCESEQFVPATGQWYYVISQPIIDTSGRVVNVLEGITDITERKQAEDMLHGSEAKLSAITNSAMDAIILMSNEGKIIFWNPAAETIFSYSADEAIGKNLHDFLTPSRYHQNHLEAFPKWQVTGEGNAVGKTLELNAIKKNGKEFTIELSLSSVKIQNRWMAVGIIRDITERKQAEEIIKHNNEELIKLNAEKDKFFSIIAHDLRSPFNGFVGLTEIMAEKFSGLSIDQMQAFAKDIRNSATNLLRLLENLLHWASMKQGLIPFNPKLVQLLGIVNESTEFIMEAAKNKEIKIICHIHDEVKVFVDSNILQMVLRNLISNAVKFTPKGGDINISAKATNDKDIEISIRDTGIGMDSSMLDNLFRIDVQTNREGTEGEPSTGLGLILCKEFVEKSGGKIWAESEEGKGTVFYFSVPESREGLTNDNMLPDH